MLSLSKKGLREFLKWSAGSFSVLSALIVSLIIAFPDLIWYFIDSYLLLLAFAIFISYLVADKQIKGIGGVLSL